MNQKGPVLVNLRRIDSLGTFFFDFRKLIAPNEARYCGNIIYSQLHISIFNKNRYYARETIFVVTFGSQFIKKTDVVLYVVFLCIFQWPTRS